MMRFLDVNYAALTVWGYPISHLELWGTLLNLWSVWLMTRKKMLTWPVGIVGCAILSVLLFKIQLYADLFENIYYVVTGFYGWWLWSLHRKREETRALPARFSEPGSLAGWAVVSLIGGWALAQFLGHLHQWWPGAFPAPQSYALIDASTTVMSLIAQILMAHRRTECWVYWIVVDVLNTWLYWQKQTVFLAAEYGVFLVVASYGLWNWMREAKKPLPLDPLGEVPHVPVDV